MNKPPTNITYPWPEPRCGGPRDRARVSVGPIGCDNERGMNEHGDSRGRRRSLSKGWIGIFTGSYCNTVKFFLRMITYDASKATDLSNRSLQS
jgi:hypothetical protein